jgi:thioredoxin-related protein
LPKVIEKKNEELADKYNPKGSFPLTLLMDEKGNIIKRWEGYINLSPEAFVNELNITLHGRSTVSAKNNYTPAGTQAHG